MTPEEAAARLDQLATDIPRAAETALLDVLRRYRIRAIWWSSGGFSTATLRRMGHPYARAERGQQRLEPARINVQSRALVEGWAISPIERRGSTLSASLYNEAPEAAFMGRWEGDTFVEGPRSRMRARPLPEKVLAEIEQANAVEEALERAISEVMR